MKYTKEQKEKATQLAVEMLKGINIPTTNSSSKIQTRIINESCKNQKEKQILIDALNSMLYIFDRGLGDGTIGRNRCDKAIESLKEVGIIYRDKKLKDCIVVTRGEERDVDSTKLTVVITKDGLKYNASGHINNRTNFVHLSADEEIDEVGMEEAGIDLDEIGVQIENREIEIV